MEPMADFARRLRRLRGPLTQHELAARARMHRSHLAKIELGQREPTVSTIVKLARALRVRPGQLRPGEEPEETSQTVDVG